MTSSSNSFLPSFFLLGRESGELEHDHSYCSNHILQTTHTIKARPFKMKRDKFGNWVLRSSQGMVSYRSVQCLGYLKVKWKVKDQWPEKNTRPSICFFVVIGIIYFSTKKKMGFGRNMGWVVNCMCQFFGTTDQLFSSILK